MKLNKISNKIQNVIFSIPLEQKRLTRFKNVNRDKKKKKEEKRLRNLRVFFSNIASFVFKTCARRVRININGERRQRARPLLRVTSLVPLQLQIRGWMRRKQKLTRQRFDKAEVVLCGDSGNSGVLMETIEGGGGRVQFARSQKASRNRHKYFNLSPCAQIQQYGALRTVSRNLPSNIRLPSPTPKTRIQPVANKSQKAVPRFGNFLQTEIRLFYTFFDKYIESTIINLSMNFSKE